MTGSVKMRQHVERQIVTAVIDALLAQGFEIAINNGGDEWEVPFTSNRNQLLAHIMLADDDNLHIRSSAEIGKLGRGWVHAVYGNDGYDVIADYSTNLEPWIGEGTAVEKEMQKWED